MFGKILIANRGEIACRVIRTCRRLGIGTVAVYSEADRDALHVEMADEAVSIGPAPAAQSYLVIEKIVEACRQTGAEAVHPGYGFLSERTEFARALAEAGIVFIGPNAGAIEAMGDKIESKRAAARAGVSTVPGGAGVISSAEEAVRVAGEIGYPVMIKASAGGGGKGMRVAQTAKEVAEGFARARSEAASSFGDDRVFVEKFIVDPRHVEIQVLGDKHGNVIHLGERECSIQRRNQKIVEEAPSPLLDPDTRRAMGDQAVALAKAVSYDSAGTVEFVVSQDKSFYFLEMNTRLQVEHPVTELVTGIDLVEQMIRIAAGEELAIRQEDVTLTGWAVESRLYAEDPFRNFLPSTGRLETYRTPPAGKAGDTTLRIDTGVVEGSEITLFYDPIIAKIVTHGPTRAAAVEAMSVALDRTLVGGIRHNIPFLAALMEHPRWRAGRLSTAFIAEEFPEGFTGAALTPGARTRLAAAALAVHLVERVRLDRLTGRLHPHSGGIRRDWFVKLAEEEVHAAIVRGRPGVPLDIEVTLDGGPPLRLTSDWTPGTPLWTGRVGEVKAIVRIEPTVAGYRLSSRGVGLEATVMAPYIAELDRRMPPRTDADTSRLLVCPMPGLVLSIHACEGQRVEAGETLAVVEAMKMENVLRAERGGVVKAVHAAPGDSLSVDAVIMEFE